MDKQFQEAFKKNFFENAKKKQEILMTLAPISDEEWDFIKFYHESYWAPLLELHRRTAVTGAVKGTPEDLMELAIKLPPGKIFYDEKGCAYFTGKSDTSIIDIKLEDD